MGAVGSKKRKVKPKTFDDPNQVKWTKQEERAWDKAYEQQEKQDQREEQKKGELVERDRKALKELFESANGLKGMADWNSAEPSPNPEFEWKEDWNWGSNTDLQQWFGIETNLLTGRVIGINLSNNHLTGTLCDSIFNLSELESMDFSNNGYHKKEGVEFNHGEEGLTGTFPTAEQLSRLKKLKTLNLAGNNFSGSLPVGIGTDACAPQLEKLDVSYNAALGGEISQKFVLKPHVVINIGHTNEHSHNVENPKMFHPWFSGASFASENLTRICWWNTDMQENRLLLPVKKSSAAEVVEAARLKGHKWAMQVPPPLPPYKPEDGICEHGKLRRGAPKPEGKIVLCRTCEPWQAPQETFGELGCAFHPWQEAWAAELEKYKKGDLYIVCHTAEFHEKFMDEAAFIDEEKCKVAGFDPTYLLDEGERAHNILDWERRMIMKHTGGITPTRVTNEFGEVSTKYHAVKRRTHVYFVGSEGWPKPAPHWYQGKEEQ